MPTRDQLTQERLDALLAMITDDGAKPPGEVDPEHVEAIRNTDGFGEGRDVAQAHAEGRGPP